MEDPKSITPLELAKIFHEEYERLAPMFGYETREETRQFDESSPNGKLMVAVCKSVLERGLTYNGTGGNSRAG